MNDAFDSFSIIVGLAAVGIGFYELFTGKLLWREEFLRNSKENGTTRGKRMEKSQLGKRIQNNVR